MEFSKEWAMPNKDTRQRQINRVVTMKYSEAKKAIEAT